MRIVRSWFLQPRYADGTPTWDGDRAHHYESLVEVEVGGRHYGTCIKVSRDAYEYSNQDDLRAYIKRRLFDEAGLHIANELRKLHDAT